MIPLFVTIPVVNESDKKLEGLRINVDNIDRYRPWLDKDGDSSKTLIVFKIGRQVVADITAEELDKKIKEECSYLMASM